MVEPALDGLAWDGKTPTWLCRRKLLSDLWTGLPNHQPIQPLPYSWCLGHRDNQKPLIPGVSDFVLCTKLRPPTSSHRHCMLLILSPPTGSPWLQAHWLGQFWNPLGRSNSVRSGITQQDGNRHVRWELLWRHSEGSGSIYSQASPTWRPTDSDIGRHSGWDSLKNQLRRQWHSPGTPLWEPRLTACRSRWPASSTSGETTSGAQYSNPSILKTSHCGGWPNVWWEFLLHLPLVTQGGIALSNSKDVLPSQLPARLPWLQESVLEGGYTWESASQE